MFGNVKSLRELFEIELRYAYAAEKTLVEKGIPSMIESASSPELRSALQAHLGETQQHVTRLENVFGALGVTREIHRQIGTDAIGDIGGGTHVRIALRDQCCIGR